MARPTAGSLNRKSHRILFRLTHPEFQRLESAAQKAGLSVHLFARQASLCKGANLVIRRSQMADPALLKRLEKIGFNLNQLVRYAHMTGIVQEKVEPLCDQIAEVVYRTIED